MRLFPKNSKEIMGAIQLPLSEVARLAGVTPRQVRYWEKKGLLKSHQDGKNANHKFTIFAILDAMRIKDYLDQGFTLQAAGEKLDKYKDLLRALRRFYRERLVAVDQTDQSIEINLGPLSGDQTKVVVASVVPGKPVEIKLKKHQPLD